MAASDRIAFVGPDRQIHAMGPDGTGRRQVTYSKVPSQLSMWGGDGGADSSIWPCWSPDGRWLACFRVGGGGPEEGPCTVAVVEVDGVEEQQLVDLGDRRPVYAQWNSMGDRLAVLVQDQRELQLYACRLGEVGHRRVVETGVPMFFSWTPDGTRLLVHVGGHRAGTGRLVLRRADGMGEAAVFPDAPGSFCTPMFARGQAVFAAAGEGRSHLCVSDMAGRRARRLATLDGLLAVVPSPSGDVIAVSAAPRGDGSPYDGIWLVPVEGGGLERLVDEECIAFLWDRAGRRILYVTVDRDRDCMRWCAADVGSRASKEICHFWPSRDQMYCLHFFEQFACSHHAISSDGSTLVYAGYPHPARRARKGREPCVHAVDLGADSAEPRLLARGSFAVFAPR